VNTPKNRHTPGPWEQLKDSSVIYGVNDPERDRDGFRVAVAVCGDELRPRGGLKFGDERDANARLIAAAPNMLDALKAAFYLLDDRLAEPIRGADARKVIEEAIAKAEGR